MYEFISGKLVEMNPTYAVIETGGVGYLINISLQTFAILEGKTEAMLHLHQVVREDAHLLFGFAERQERELFRQLISVSGVGANTARIILSSLSPVELERAIVVGDIDTLKRIKGIGLKTAQRIIVDLKDKIAKGSPEPQIFAPVNNTLKQEALSALVMLGFTKSIAEKIIDQIVKRQPEISVEALVKQALKGM
ncbi:MAG TPA: Holliday junction branch migration protein RuvA [Tenuifilaceae bacterium]|nr:Holliday junction branch migration protein RuvA [Tenuifilaceae bacterium]HPE18926.1 Holliday junction branch migration protein RuvA [Tenuifilaceae bacterium]HPJ46207.1 Holliday junction branch migration protein RuvA [Tenuifilaceae bacterium]HPQ34209.1 Holliday junction branch migration protein RuvA [Tenuifilaceae bacterium]HRX67855.1 Holliday junction branch migration protein RuvA [Tenuifilaceae bacterium]